MSVPSAVGSNAAKPVGSEAPDAAFDALFAAFESLTGEGVDAAEAPPSNNPSSEPQPDESSPVSPPGGPGAWIAQIDPVSTNDQSIEAATQSSTDKPPEDNATAQGGGDHTPIQSDAKTAQARKFHAAKTQIATLAPWMDNDDTSSSGEAGPIQQESSSRPMAQTSAKNSETLSGSQIMSEVLSDKLTGPATNAQAQLQPPSIASDASGLPVMARTAHSKESAQSDRQTSEKRDEADVSDPASDRPVFTQVAQLVSGVKTPVLPGDGGRLTSDPMQAHDADGKTAAVDMTASDRAMQTPTRADLPKSNSPNSDPPVVPSGDNVALGNANPSLSGDQQSTDAATGSKAPSSNRTATAAPAPDSPTTVRAQSDDAVRGQFAEGVFSHHADAGMTFMPASDHPTQTAMTNADAPVRISFSTAPNSVEQPAFDALALRIAAKSSDGDRNFSIRLDPPELGRIEVNLNVNASGHAQAEISADRPQTLDLLQRDAPALERALKDAGLNLAGGFAFSLKGEGRSGGNWRYSHHGGRGRNIHVAGIDAANASASLTGTAAMTARAYGLPISRVDIRV
jgi:flagellar hook-length control protein FliK